MNPDCCEATFCALNKWYKAEFEKLGWMILAKNKGMEEKIDNYLASLQYLKQSLEKKIEEIHDIDKKNDLLLMHKNVDILMKHVHKDFKKNKNVKDKKAKK